MAFAIFVYANSTAQEGKIRFGVKAGLNVASLGGDYVDGFDPRLSFHLGGLVEIPLVGKFAIQPELLYSSQGYKYNSYLGYDEDYNSHVSLDYINVPVMAKYYIIEGLSVELGPQVGVLVSAKSKYEDSDGTDKMDVKDGYKSIELAMGIGASYRLKNGVFFSLRFNKGISNINDTSIFYYDGGDEPIYNETTYKRKNNVFQVSSGYSF